MAVVNHSKKWLYLMEPHTASRAVTEVLLNQLGGSKCGHHHISIDHLTRRDRCEIPAKKIGDYRVVTTVRNPFDMLVTRFAPQTRHDTNFGEWVRERLDKDIGGPLPSAGLEATASHFVYYEHLVDDLQMTFGEYIDLDWNQKHKTIGKQPWYHYYENDEELVNLLSNHWSGYLSKYGYEVAYDPYAAAPVVAINQTTRDRLVIPIR